MASVVSLRINDPRWEAFVCQRPGATAFHYPAWANLLSECYGYRAFALAIIDDAERIVAGLPVLEVSGLFGSRRWVSLPFTDYCPPLVKSDEDPAALTDVLVRQRNSHNLASIEVRWLLPDHPGLYLDPHYVLHALPLRPNPQALFETFENKFRQYPRKAERAGLHVVSTGTRQDLDRFYQIHLKTRVKLGVPIQPRRFFDLLWERVIGRGMGTVIVVADKTEKPISGAVVLHLRDKAMIKFSGSDPAYLETRCHYFTFWKSIEWACLHGMQVIDFGRTDVLEEGLRKFKNGWGTREEPLVYSVIADRPPRPSNGRLSPWMSAVIRHSPPVVCRVLGELFYRYAA